MNAVPNRHRHDLSNASRGRLPFRAFATAAAMLLAQSFSPYSGAATADAGTDNGAKACVRQNYSNSHPDPAGTKYEVAVQNVCNRPIIVDLRRKSGDITSQTIDPGKESKYQCVDHEGYTRNCGGWDGWTARYRDQ
jgi:hypothetical protein